MDVNVKQRTWSVSIRENEVFKTMWVTKHLGILKILINLTTALSNTSVLVVAY